MKKQELIKNIKSLAREASQQWPHEEMVELPDVLREINQLDERETLSPEWIEEYQEEMHMDGEWWSTGEKKNFVWVDDLENLLVPKQELPVVPTWFDEWWKDVAKSGGSLFHNVERFYDELFSSGTIEAYSYISSPDNKKKLLNIIINELDYVVEEEQKYYIYDKTTNSYMCFNADKTRLNWYKSMLRFDCFTEQEIRGFDNGDILFEHFSVKVEELEE